MAKYQVNIFMAITNLTAAGFRDKELLKLNQILVIIGHTKNQQTKVSEYTNDTNKET